jgi:hypothetical protein
VYLEQGVTFVILLYIRDENAYLLAKLSVVRQLADRLKGFVYLTSRLVWLLAILGVLSYAIGASYNIIFSLIQKETTTKIKNTQVESLQVIKLSNKII